METRFRKANLAASKKAKSDLEALTRQCLEDRALSYLKYSCLVAQHDEIQKLLQKKRVQGDTW